MAKALAYHWNGSEEGVWGQSHVAFGSFFPAAGSVFAQLGGETDVVFCSGLLLPRGLSTAV